MSSHTPNKGAKMEKEAVKVTVKKTDNFVPLQAVVDMDWKNEENKKKLNEMDSSFFLSMSKFFLNSPILTRFAESYSFSLLKLVK